MPAPSIRRFWRDQAGTTAIEYALLGTLIAIVLIGSFVALGSGTQGLLYAGGAATVMAEQTDTLP